MDGTETALKALIERFGARVRAQMLAAATT